MVRSATGQENVADFVELYFLLIAASLETIWTVEEVILLLDGVDNCGFHVAIIGGD